VTATQEQEGRVVVLCRSQGRRALVERLVAASLRGSQDMAAETYTSAVDACLSVARRPARAAIVNLEDIEGTEREVVSAMRHAQPNLRIYTIVKPEEEPLGRRLLRAGVTDYFVLPTDIGRLPAILASAERRMQRAE
jgi:DNA-binding NarL/FixJ family response regulator